MRVISFIQGLPVYEERAIKHDPHSGQFMPGAHEFKPQSDRLDFTVEHKGNRLFIDAHLKEKAKKYQFVRYGHENPPAQSWSQFYDHAADDRRCRANLYSKGKGFAKESLKASLDYLQQHYSVKSFSAYIEHDNLASQALFKSQGFREVKRNKHGSNWELHRG